MELTLSPELEKQVKSLIRRGEYPNAEALVADALRALARERERQHLEATLEIGGLDNTGLKKLLREAEDSGEYTEMTADDWKDIEREGLVLVNSRKSA